MTSPLSLDLLDTRLKPLCDAYLGSTQTPGASIELVVGDNGAIFEPTNLKPSYQIDGSRVRFTAQVLVTPAPLISGARVVRITSIRSLPSAEFKLPPAARPEIPRLP